MNEAQQPKARRLLLLLTVDTEASMAGLRPLPPDAMVYGRLDGGVYGIERIMDCCEERGLRATFFVSTLEALHYGDAHVRSMCEAVLERGHDAQLHVHPIWLGGEFTDKRLSGYGYERQLEAIGRAQRIFERACGKAPLAHRAGGLRVNADSLRALAALGIGIDSSVAPGFHPYELGDGVAPPNAPRRLGQVAEVPVTTFRQFRVGGWTPRRTFDINADSLAELRFVLDRAAAEGVAAVTLLTHSFSFVRRDPSRTAFSPAQDELAKFERFLDHVAERPDVEAATFSELAARIDAEPSLLAGPDFSPTSGFARTYCRSWQRFGSSWKSKAFALALPAAAAGLAALAIGLLRWLIP